MDAIAVTPRIHRNELMSYVHHPIVLPLVYSGGYGGARGSALDRLTELCAQHDCMAPYGIFGNASLHQSSLGESSSKFKWREQLTRFHMKAQFVFDTFGSWAADYFILESIKIFDQLLAAASAILFNWSDEEKLLMARLLGQDVELLRLRSTTETAEPSNVSISPKVLALISFLLEQKPEQTKGLIFVQQRVAASVLSKLLQVHPSVREKYASAPFVGLSNTNSRKYAMPELLDLKTQSEALAEFRAHAKNIIVATNALEEGIDVQACNVVVCFDPPQNVRSFIQRRGRARKERSVFALMFAEGTTQEKLSEWTRLEAELQAAYRDPNRKQQPSDIAEYVGYVLTATSTRASLTSDQTLSHLYHFCSQLPQQPYTDLRPTFSFSAVDGTIDKVHATVILPNCVAPEVRRAHSQQSWETCQAAAKDAAFHCYKGLYEAGLLNENLLPITTGLAFQELDVDELDATIDVPPEFDPWAEVSKAWDAPSFYRTRVHFHCSTDSSWQSRDMIVTLPCSTPQLLPLQVFWNSQTIVDLSFVQESKVGTLLRSTTETLKQITELISRSTHSDRSTGACTDFVALFSPDLADNALLEWLESHRSRLAVKAFIAHNGIQALPKGFIRCHQHAYQPQIFDRWLIEEDGAPILCYVSLPKRRNFASPIPISGELTVPNPDPKQSRSPGAHQYPSDECTIDQLPFEIARLNLLYPMILQHFAHGWMIDALQSSVLGDVWFKDPGLLITAITHPSLQWATNYERLEFLGDSVLKLVISTRLYQQHPNWPEGFLSKKRAVLVSNAFLAKAALEAGLVPFIRTAPISWKHWSPLRLTEVGAGREPTRPIRTKMVADVVEALVGAAYIDGGLELARRCTDRFLPTMCDTTPIFSSNFASITNNSIDRIETVVGHKFTTPQLLMEALTHPSCQRDHQTQSYQRLEYLGDAVLDMIIASRLMEHRHCNRTPGDMTRIKAAMVNSHLLGFFCMNFSHTERGQKVRETSRDHFQVSEDEQEIHLWQFMRFHGEAIVKHREQSLARFAKLSPSISADLFAGLSYPWATMTMLRPEKFFSDIVESLLGAIYVDSGGSLDACVGFLQRLQIMSYLQRVLDLGVDTVHPRTRLDWKTGSSTVDYQLTPTNDSESGTLHWACTVLIDETECVTVNDEDLETREEAIVAAAEAALARVEGKK